jgi:hypothetical protein
VAHTLHSPSWFPRNDEPARSCSVRHAGNHFAARSGAGLRDLMVRMGHDSERAAMIYQHEAQDADKTITDAIDTHVQGQQPKDGNEAGVLAPAG